MSLDTAGSHGHSAAIGRERLTLTFHSKPPGGLSISSYVDLCCMLLCVINSLHSQAPVWLVGVERAEGESDKKRGSEHTHVVNSLLADPNGILNTGVFCFIFRFGTDMQMINLTTGEFQLTKACPYQVGSHPH